MIAFIFVVGDPHRNKTTHGLASLTTSPLSISWYGNIHHSIHTTDIFLLLVVMGDIGFSGESALLVYPPDTKNCPPNIEIPDFGLTP